MDPAWAETGDRYLLKLFRDYVFHQVTADGRPWLDLSHVVYCLNRLDSGSLEKVSRFIYNLVPQHEVTCLKIFYSFNYADLLDVKR